MKTVFTFIFIGIAVITGYTAQANTITLRFDSVAVDSIVDEILSQEELSQDSFPTEEQFKEVIKRGDTTFITLGNKKIKIIEHNGETEVKIQNKEDSENSYESEDEDSSDAEAEEPFNEEKNENKFKGQTSCRNFACIGSSNNPA